MLWAPQQRSRLTLSRLIADQMTAIMPCYSTACPELCSTKGLCSTNELRPGALRPGYKGLLMLSETVGKNLASLLQPGQTRNHALPVQENRQMNV